MNWHKLMLYKNLKTTRILLYIYCYIIKCIILFNISFVFYIKKNLILKFGLEFFLGIWLLIIHKFFNIVLYLSICPIMAIK